MVQQPQLFTKPLYLIVRDRFVERITTGVWPPGMMLPNEGQLAQELGTSLGTVRRALSLLDEARLILRRQGFGTFVNDFSLKPVHFSNICDSEGAQIDGIIETKCAESQLATDDQRKTLRLGRGEMVFKVERVRRHQSWAFETEVSILPARLFGVVPDDLGTYEISSLAQKNRIIVGRAVEAVRPVLADVIAAIDLQVEEGTPLLLLERVIFSADGVPLEWKIGKCHTGHVRYRVELT